MVLGIAVLERVKTMLLTMLDRRSLTQTSTAANAKYYTPELTVFAMPPVRRSALLLTVGSHFGKCSSGLDAVVPTRRHQGSEGLYVIKSELVQRLAALNPHLYQRDIADIFDAILGEITGALARGDRVELRGFGSFSTRQRQARRTQSTHRRQGHRGAKVRALLQDRQGNTRAVE
jgi:nucleoid DNA-binding protein